ncbi:MAG: hypothetical protein IPG42_08465 [Betaproteobacteria bacterium]|jgi:lipid-A-disaccharide synthase-like uncharacterized protein|nr:hypothetical protein [Betaproteobacteria bacterium]MBK7653837.1 hypothetical protein [Betaproteobacteria bacterium]MBP6645817.1 hypothetical protein [Burkholderiaceae bacterium]
MTAPLLPGLSMHLWGQHLGWALVLAAITGWLVQRANAPIRRTLMALGAMAALVPGPQGPVYWLALAYQMPSLVSVALALWWLQGEAGGQQRPRMPAAFWAGQAVLGGVLLLDTLALLPWPIYAVGFGSAPLTVWLVVCALFCVRPDLRTWGWSGVLIGLVFAVTRLPTGNLWDSVSDPWLFLLAVATLLRRAGGQKTA